jgi:hypothetical protein
VGNLVAHVTSSWIAQGGCDGPENGLEALEYAHENMSWRVGAIRAYVDITDAGHHTNGTNCNFRGPCTNHDLATITALIGSSGAVYAVGPSDPGQRSGDGSLDPFLVAGATGGKSLALESGAFDLESIGIVDVLSETVRLTFESSSVNKAMHNIRVRVQIGSKVSEFSPGLIPYLPIDPTIRQSPRESAKPR